MPRYAFKIEYIGAPFRGWQTQIDLPTVQGSFEAALARVAGGEHRIAAAGRTDTGVHALGQVAHVDIVKAWDPFRLMEAVNYHLKPEPVAIVACVEVAEDWHARFSALQRRYLFRLVSRRAPMTVEMGRVWHVRHGLDVEAMRKGAAHLIGNHDFTTFRSTICQALSPVKTLDRLDIEAVDFPGGTEFRFHVAARSFLHNQVRSFVGTLERVGAGSWDPDDVKAALEAKERAACGPVSPPQGLYLADVTYAEPVFEAV
ncbi:MAG: tRNA pseudouridine(38-40) synthase TruA [Pseudomonadota bacterium]